MIDISFPQGSFRVNENDLGKPFSGGRVNLVADNGEQAKTKTNPDGDELSEVMKISGVSLLINYRKDGPMQDWPSTKEEMLKRRFTVFIREEPPTK